MAWYEKFNFALAAVTLELASTLFNDPRLLTAPILFVIGWHDEVGAPAKAK